MHFVSYSRKDSEFVLDLVEQLRKAGVELWLDQRDIKVGQPWDDELSKALEDCAGVLVVLSPDAVDSEIVKNEIAKARKHGKRILPLLYKPCEIPLQVNRLQYLDWTRESDRDLAGLVAAVCPSTAATEHWNVPNPSPHFTRTPRSPR